MSDVKAPRANAVTQTLWLDSNRLQVKVMGAGTLVFDKRSAHGKMRARAEDEGWVKRLINAAALDKDPATGKPATPQIKFEQVKRLADHYATGTDEWSLPRNATGPRLDLLILAAVCEVTGKSEDAIRVMVAEGAARANVGEPAYLTKLGTAPAVVPALTRLREEAAAKVASGIDADQELAGMMGGEAE